MPRLTWSDLLIEDITPDQFREWIAPWAGVVQGTVAPAFLSKFGVWFLRRPEGHVEILDVFRGRLDRFSDSYEELVGEVNQAWWQETYLFSELVLQLHELGKVPGPGQCYAIAPHPALGGPDPWTAAPIDPESVMVTDVFVWQSLCARFVGAEES